MNKLRTIFSLMLGFMYFVSWTQVDIYTYGNSRIYPGQVNQTEVFIVSDPNDHNTLFTSCNTLNFIPFFVSEGIYVTNDGGAFWT